MKVLMIGGTGIISTGVSEHLTADGTELWLLTRGNRPGLIPAGARTLRGDITDEAGTAELLKEHHFDAVIDWMVYTPEQAERDIRLFHGKTGQYVFIGSGSSYQRPSRNHIVTEETPLENPFSSYARNKAACETRLLSSFHKAGFPVTIVRPSLTYGNLVIPYVMNSWQKPWTLIERMRQGKRIIVPGDGTSLWEITHNSDFAVGIAGLLGNPAAVGEAFHITSGEVMTWEEILRQIADAAGVAAKVTHISSEFICAFMPDEAGGLFGDKISSVIYDNSKIKRFVPAYRAKIPFREGIARTISWLSSHPENRAVDTPYDEMMDRIIAAHDAGMAFSQME